MVQPSYIMLPLHKIQCIPHQKQKIWRKSKNLIVVDGRPGFFVSTKLKLRLCNVERWPAKNLVIVDGGPGRPGPLCKKPDRKLGKCAQRGSCQTRIAHSARSRTTHVHFLKLHNFCTFSQSRCEVQYMYDLHENTWCVVGLITHRGRKKEHWWPDDKGSESKRKLRVATTLSLLYGVLYFAK